MSDDQVIDAEVVDAEAPAAPPVESTAMVRRQRRSEVMHPLAVDELVQSFSQYQEMLPRLLDGDDYQAADGKRFVKKSGWRKIATAFDLDVILVADEVERDEDGNAVRAKVIARAIAPSGRTMDGDGYCAIDEKRFANPKARTKVENDLRATATTRAKNRAIADLVGMGAVSAEEISDSDRHATGPPYGPAVSKQTAPLASQALIALYEGDADAAERVWNAIKTKLGYMPEAVAVGLSLLPPNVDAS